MSTKSIRREVAEKLIALSTAAFGLVAALAWNDAVQEIFKMLFPERGTLVAKLSYALFVTLVVVLVTMRLGRISERIKSD